MIKRLLILLILLIAVPCWGANIYIDLDWTGTESGTFAEPYNQVSDISGSISASHDYYFRCGSSETTTGEWVISVNGNSAEDRIVFGAYYDNGGTSAGQSPTGSAVLETGVFGENCSNSDAKPIIQDNANDNAVAKIEANYIQFNSLQIKEGDTAMYVKSDYCLIDYCRIGWANYGIRVWAADNNTISYNYIYTDLGAATQDGVQLNAYADSNTMEYNVFDGFQHTGGVGMTNSSANHPDDNVIRYNSVFGWDDLSDQCFSINGDTTLAHHNYCENSGLFNVGSGTNNVISYNVINTISQSGDGTRGGAIKLQAVYGDDADPPTEDIIDLVGTKVYNNVIYDGTEGATAACILLSSIANTEGITEGSEIVNNLCIGSFSAEPFRVNDLGGTIESASGDPDCNVWRNNLAYGWVDANYAQIESSHYVTHTLFNSNYAKAYDNKDEDPGLNNPAAGEFWPATSGSNVVGAGYDLGNDYDDLWDPDSSDLTTSPLTVETETQPTSWIIGAYGLVGATPTYPIQGAAGNFKLN